MITTSIYKEDLKSKGLMEELKARKELTLPYKGTQVYLLKVVDHMNWT